MARTSSTTPRRIAATLVLITALGSGCAKQSPTEPAHDVRYTLSGQVHLVGYLVNMDGTSAGTRVVTDADGVPVELRFGTTVLARTETVAGVYRFAGLKPGDYRVRAIALANIWDETTDLVVKDGDLIASQPIELRSRGDIHPAPNPFSDLVVLSFGVPDSQFVSLKIRDLGGGIVESLFGQWLPQGRYLAAWNGYDLHRQPASGHHHWATYESNGETRAQLLFH